MDTVASSQMLGDWFFQLQILQEVTSHSISTLDTPCVCMLTTHPKGF